MFTTLKDYRLIFILLGCVLLLFAYFSLSAYNNYKSHKTLHEIALKRWKNRGEDISTHLSNFFFERRADVENIAQAIMSNYYHTRALGMSNRYGVKGLAGFVQQFLKKQTLFLEDHYPGLCERMVFWDREKGFLADTTSKKRKREKWKPLFGKKGSMPLPFGKQNSYLIITSPVRFAGEIHGKVAIVLSVKFIREKFLQGELCNAGCRTALREKGGEWLCPVGGEWKNTLECNTAALTRKFEQARKNGDQFFQKQKIEGTPLYLYRMINKKSLLGNSSPRKFLLGMSGLFIAVFIICIFLLRAFLRNKMLSVRIEEEEKRMEEADRINKELQREVAERKETEEALRLAEKRYRDIFHNANEGIFQSTPHGSFIRVNPALARMLKYDSPEDMIRSIHSLNRDFYLYPEKRSEFKDILTREERVNDYEYQVKCKDGSSIWIAESAHAVRDAEGHVEYYEGMIRNISLRKELETALVRARDAAEESNRAKSSFLANISHEIRTPLNAIQGMAELLKDRDIGPEETKMAQTIFDSSRNLLDIINDLLDLSKIDANRFQLHPQEIDLPGFCSQVIKPYILIAENKGINLELRMEVVPDYIEVDETRLRQILTNLIGNSIKFTEQGRIVLYVQGGREENGLCEVTFSVEDTGIGIPEKELEKIFQEFERSESSRTHSLRGTGLGLSLSHKFVQLMGGTGISVSSRENRGSVFWFSLKLQKTDGSTLEQEKGKEEIPFEWLSELRVLAAEDNLINRELLEKMFQALHITECEFAENGKEALRSLEDNPAYWDVLLLDLEMPVMDGRKAIQKIREKGFDIYKVIVSAHARQDTKEECLDMGADAFISKPYTLDKLKEVLGRFAGMAYRDEKEVPAHNVAAGEGSFEDTIRDFLVEEYAIREEELKEIITATAESMGDYLHRIELGIQYGDTEKVRKETHDLKGMLGNVGLFELYIKARELEEASKSGDIEKCKKFREEIIWACRGFLHKHKVRI